MLGHPRDDDAAYRSRVDMRTQRRLSEQAEIERLNKIDRRSRELRDIQKLNKQLAELDNQDTTHLTTLPVRPAVPRISTAVTSPARPAARWTEVNKWGSVLMLWHKRLGQNSPQCCKALPLEIWAKILERAGSRFAEGTTEWEDDRSKERLIPNTSWSVYHSSVLRNKPLNSLCPIERCIYLNDLHKVYTFFMNMYFF